MVEWLETDKRRWKMGWNKNYGHGELDLESEDAQVKVT